jgi:hypothetical protein
LDKNIPVLIALKNEFRLNYIQNFNIFLTEEVCEVQYKNQAAVCSENYRRHTYIRGESKYRALNVTRVLHGDLKISKVTKY